MIPALVGYDEMHKALIRHSRIARISLALLGLVHIILSLATGQIIWASSIPLILVLTLSPTYMRLIGYLIYLSKKNVSAILFYRV